MLDLPRISSGTREDSNLSARTEGLGGTNDSLSATKRGHCASVAQG